MSYLIDTNIISELRKGSRCDAAVAAWYAKLSDRELYLSVLVLGEIRWGDDVCAKLFYLRLGLGDAFARLRRDD